MEPKVVEREFLPRKYMKFPFSTTTNILRPISNFRIFENNVRMVCEPPGIYRISSHTHSPNTTYVLYYEPAKTYIS